jgi:hypothetical protein
MSHPVRVSEVLHAQSVETRYDDVDGSRVTDLRPLDELVDLVNRIEEYGGKLVSVGPYQEK